MIHPTDAILPLVLLTVLLALNSNRLVGLVQIMACQGILVSMAPFFLGQHEVMAVGTMIFLPIMLVIKGILIPGIMLAAVHKVSFQRELRPIVGYHASLFIGLALIVTSAFMTDKLLHHLSLPGDNTLLLIAAITTMASGLFLLMARRKAITQIIGYLMMENGIYLFGTALAKQTHTQYLVEFGVLLDLLVGVMVMGIVLHNINSAFDDIDTALLSQLKD